MPDDNVLTADQIRRWKKLRMEGWADVGDGTRVPQPKEIANSHEALRVERDAAEQDQAILHRELDVALAQITALQQSIQRVSDMAQGDAKRLLLAALAQPEARQ